MASAEEIRGLSPRRYPLMAGRCSPSAGTFSSSASPSATARCWLMSASMATTGSPAPARWRMNREDRVVLPLPPLPTNATFTKYPNSKMKTVVVSTLACSKDHFKRSAQRVQPLVANHSQLRQPWITNPAAARDEHVASVGTHQKLSGGEVRRLAGMAAFVTFLHVLGWGTLWLVSNSGDHRLADGKLFGLGL